MPTPTSAICSKHPRAGFTLLEVLMSLLILAILAAFLSGILQSSLLSHQHIREDLQQAPARQADFHARLTGIGDLPDDESETALIPLEEQETE